MKLFWGLAFLMMVSCGTFEPLLKSSVATEQSVIVVNEPGSDQASGKTADKNTEHDRIRQQREYEARLKNKWGVPVSCAWASDEICAQGMSKLLQVSDDTIQEIMVKADFKEIIITDSFRDSYGRDMVLVDGQSSLTLIVEHLAKQPTPENQEKRQREKKEAEIRTRELWLTQRFSLPISCFPGLPADHCLAGLATLVDMEPCELPNTYWYKEISITDSFEYRKASRHVFIDYRYSKRELFNKL